LCESWFLLSFFLPQRSLRLLQPARPPCRSLHPWRRCQAWNRSAGSALGIFKIRQTLGRRIDRVPVHIRWISGSVNGRWAVVPSKPRRSRLKVPVVTLGTVALVPIKFLRCAVHESGVIHVR